MNGIPRLWERWDWRPTYYMRIDHTANDNESWRQDVMRAAGACEQVFLWERFKDGYPEKHSLHFEIPYGVGELDNAVWLKHCKHNGYMYDNIKAAQSWHLPDICTAYGGISVMCQIASIMGYDEIYLLGCDLGYVPDYTLNHAAGSYSTFGINGDKAKFDNENMLAMHKFIKRSCPIPVYNATMGGALEVYPRVKLEDVLNGAQKEN